MISGKNASYFFFEVFTVEIGSWILTCVDTYCYLLTNFSYLNLHRDAHLGFIFPLIFLNEWNEIEAQLEEEGMDDLRDENWA